MQRRLSNRIQERYISAAEYIYNEYIEPLLHANKIELDWDEIDQAKDASGIIISSSKETDPTQLLKEVIAYVLKKEVPNLRGGKIKSIADSRWSQWSTDPDSFLSLAIPLLHLLCANEQVQSVVD